MFKVYFSDPNVNDMIVVLDTEEEALTLAKNLGALFIEEDKDNPHHYDGIDKRGRVICVEPFTPTDDFNYVGSKHHY